MNKRRLGISLVTLLAVTTLASCNTNNNDSSSSGSNSSGGAASEYILSGVDAKHEFVLFNQNKARDVAQDDGFYDHTQSFKVGDDNAFNVRPELTVLDKVTLLPADSSNWDYDFTITATVDGQPAGENYFSVVDARKGDVKFTEAAIGKTFTISVVPGGIEESKKASYTKSVTVEVVDGYNVYNAKELGYFDTRGKDDPIDAPTLETNKKWESKWYQFKEANGMNVNYTPAALIFQTNIKVTTKDLPSNFFYTAAEAKALNDDKSAGSLIDYTFLYMFTKENSSITIDGNYFSLNLSEIPLVMRESCETTAPGTVVSHAAAFKAIYGEDVKFQNINMSGNARNAVDDNDRKFSGGFIFVKGAGSKTLQAKNIIATQFYISFFGEESYNDNGYLTEFVLDQTKCYNNFNSFLYNWGSKMDVRNSLFKGCGGPVTIQDHTSTKEYEKDNGMTVLGLAPTTNFVDCTFENYVAGEEAWFQQFGATARVGQIKQMGDLYGATGLPKTYVVNDKHEGKFAAALAAADQTALFNFIALNKSGGNQGMTADPACGTVTITESGKVNVFNYAQPAYDSVYQAYVALQTAAASGASAEEQGALQQALIAAAVAKGVKFAADYSDVQARIEEYFTKICTEHMTLRGLNSNSAPVIDLGESFPLLSTDGKNAYLQEMQYVATQNPTQFVPSADQLKATPNYCAVYFAGMALVMKLADYVA